MNGWYVIQKGFFSHHGDDYGFILEKTWCGLFCVSHLSYKACGGYMELSKKDNNEVIKVFNVSIKEGNIFERREILAYE